MSNTDKLRNQTSKHQHHLSAMHPYVTIYCCMQLTPRISVNMKSCVYMQWEYSMLYTVGVAMNNYLYLHQSKLNTG